MMTCDIVLTVFNNIKLTAACLESVARHFRQRDKLIIVDNGSDNATRESLAGFAAEHADIPMEIIRIPVNQGFLRAANAGLKIARNEAVCLLSNDTVVTQGWLDRMCGLFEVERKIGVVNPMSTTFGLYPSDGQTPDDVAAGIAAKQGQYTESASCVGFCMLIKKEVISAIGFLDEVYADGYFEDTDFCRRAIAAGFICAIAKDAYVWHKEHSTFKTGEREKLFSVNRNIFEKRWGRPKRLIFAAVGRRIQADRLVEECLKAARAGDWVWLIVPKNEKNKFSGASIHGNIRLIGVSRLWLWFYPWFLYISKRKKPIDAVIIR
jgi:O-antigen biosynthesis protein